MTKSTFHAAMISLAISAIALFAVISGSVFAQSSGAVAGADAVSGSSSSAGAVGAGFGGSSGASSNQSSQNILGSGNTYEAPDFGDHVPTVFIPNLTTSNGTCANSFTVGGSGAGFGVAFAKTYVSGPCNARFTSNQLNALGHKELALEVLCSIKAVREADQRMASQYGLVFKCAQTEEPEDGQVSGIDAGVNDGTVVWFDEAEMTEVNDLVSAEMEASEAKTWGYKYHEEFTNQ